MEGVYLFGIWVVQAILYALISFELVNWKIGKGVIFSIAFILFIAAPWLFPVESDFDPETGEGRYICGLVSLLPFSIFWILGNTGSVILILTFSTIGYIRRKDPPVTCKD